MSRSFDLVVVGGLNVDVSIRMDAVPDVGEAGQAATLRESIGGKAGNQALGAARLGARVALVAAVGDDPAGQWLRDGLAAAGVDVSHVQVLPGRQSGRVVNLVEPGGQHRTVHYAGANDDLAATSSLAAGTVLVSLGVPMSALTAAIHGAGAARVVLDAGPARPLSEALLRRIDVVRGTAREVGLLAGVPGADRAAAREAARLLLERGPGLVAAGLPEGNLVRWPGDEYWLPRLEVDVVDPLGAGDAFAATLAVALGRGLDAEKAAELASAAAAYATTVLGAGDALGRRVELQALLGSLH